MSERVRLLSIRCGAIQAALDPESGALRLVTADGTPVLQGAYVAVRGEAWQTDFGRITGFECGQDRASWTLLTEGEGRRVEWKGSLEASGQGLEYRVEGLALDGFWTMRTGLCVLHPASHAGSVCIVGSPDGSRLKAEFPVHVSPHQPFRNVRRMDVALPAGCLRIDFEGDVFETEDQRNWSDASYKTYCRPLDLPRPYRVEAGDRIVHAVRLLWGPPTIPVGQSQDLGGIGTMLGPSIPADWQAFRLASLRLHHFGLDASRRDLLDAGAGFAESLGLPVRLFASGEPDGQLAAFVRSRRPAEIVLELGTDPGPWRALGGATLTVASRNNLTELNRQPPDPADWDAIGFGTNPQVHAFDVRSILETVQTHELLACEARLLALGKPVRVGPVGFCPTSWHDGDPRLHGPIGAVWTVGAIAGLMPWCEAGTFHATHGPHGIIADDPAIETPLETAWRAMAKLGSPMAGHIADGLAVLTGPQGRLAANLSDKIVEGMEPRTFEASP